jgi:CRISPR-associated protein Csx3
VKIAIHAAGGFKLVYFELPTYGVDPHAVAARIEAAAAAWNGPETVLFRGQGPVWLYGMLVHSAHATPNVATYEPRKNGYVVVNCHNGTWRPGDVIPADAVGMTVESGQIVGGENALPQRNMIVAVGGPPHSGKSVFLTELYRQLLNRMPGEVFLQRACPDGEGMWSAESDPSLAQAIRQKGKFSQDFVSWVAAAIQGLQKGFKITLLDLGGKRMPPNDEILLASTHLIILSSNEDETKAWVEYGQEHGCEVAAVLSSQLVKDEQGELDSAARSRLDAASTPVTGVLVNLDRQGPVDPYRDQVSAIAEALTRLARLGTRAS